jgi:hypothetical protein
VRRFCVGGRTATAWCHGKCLSRPRPPLLQESAIRLSIIRACHPPVRALAERGEPTGAGAAGGLDGRRRRKKCPEQQRRRFAWEHGRPQNRTGRAAPGRGSTRQPSGPPAPGCRRTARDREGYLPIFRIPGGFVGVLHRIVVRPHHGGAGLHRGCNTHDTVQVGCTLVGSGSAKAGLSPDSAWSASTLASRPTTRCRTAAPRCRRPKNRKVVGDGRSQ